MSAKDRQRLSMKPGDAIALVGAASAILLCVLALVGIHPRTLASVAAICMGTALLGHGALVTNRIFALRSPVGATEEQAKLGETASDEVLGGACAIALGVLALIGFEPLVLLAIAAIAVGGALVLAGPSRQKLAHLAPVRAAHDKRAALIPTRTTHQHRARRRRRKAAEARAKKRAASRIRAHHSESEDAKSTVSAIATEDHAKPSKRRRRRMSRAQAEPQMKSRNDSTPAQPRTDAVEPLFDPELTAPAHANPEFADPRVVAADSDDARAEALASHDLEAADEEESRDTTELEVPTVELDASHELEAGADDMRLDASHELEAGTVADDVHTRKTAKYGAADDAQLEAHPIATTESHALVKHGESALVKRAPHEMVMVAHDVEAVTHANIDRAERREPVTASEHRDVDQRAATPEIEPVAVPLRGHERLYASAFASVVGGLAAVVLGVLALAGIAHARALAEIAILVGSATILASALMHGAHLSVEQPHRADEIDEHADTEEHLAAPVPSISEHHEIEMPR